MIPTGEKVHLHVPAESHAIEKIHRRRISTGQRPENTSAILFLGIGLAWNGEARVRGRDSLDLPIQRLEDRLGHGPLRFVAHRG
jgi:hypothetical protein